MLRRDCIIGLLTLSCCSVLVVAGVPGIWLNVPFVKQKKDGCGAASIAMVMQYWEAEQGQSRNANATFIHIRDALYSRAAHGIYASAMTHYLQQNGYATFAFTGDLGALRRHLKKGRPLIVALKPGSDSTLHYVVVVGIDQQGGLVSVNDPAQRKLLKEEYSRFEQEWKGTGYWTLLAVPKTSSY